MNDPEAMRQLQAMISFIKQEADEKARELMVEAEEEFNIAKLQTVEAEKAKLRKDFERKTHQLEAKKKIEGSKQLNMVRLQVLQARQELLSGVVEDCRAEVMKVASNPTRYKDLLTKLICQSMQHIGGASVLVRARQSDQQIVQGCIEAARSLYEKVVGRPAPSATLDTAHFLPPAPGSRDDPDVATCMGGVQVTSADGRIISSNTLDDRLRIIVEQNLPGIRSNLFGKH